VTSSHVYEVRLRVSEDADRSEVWDAVVDMDGCVYSAGYCSGWTEETVETIIRSYGAHDVEYVLAQQDRKRPYRHKYHLDGHSTADGARLCFYTFLLDQALSYTPIRLCRFIIRNWACEIPTCGKPAELVAEIGLMDARISLCFEHATIEHLKTLFTPDGVTKVTGG
jgi:hypothetical protein